MLSFYTLNHTVSVPSHLYQLLLAGAKWKPHCSLICISLMNNDTKQCFMCLLANHISYFVKFLFNLLPTLIGLIVFLILICRILYIYWTLVLCLIYVLQVLHFGCFADYEVYSIFSKGFLPTVLDIMVIWIKFAHSCPF